MFFNKRNRKAHTQTQISFVETASTWNDISSDEEMTRTLPAIHLYAIAHLNVSALLIRTKHYLHPHCWNAALTSHHSRVAQGSDSHVHSPPDTHFHHRCHHKIGSEAFCEVAPVMSWAKLWWQREVSDEHAGTSCHQNEIVWLLAENSTSDWKRQWWEWRPDADCWHETWTRGTWHPRWSCGQYAQRESTDPSAWLSASRVPQASGPRPTNGRWMGWSPSFFWW